MDPKSGLPVPLNIEPPFVAPSTLRSSSLVSDVDKSL